MKPLVIAVDVDGVCADFHAAACEQWNEEAALFGADRLLPEQIKGWYWEPVFGPGWRERIIRSNLYATMQPIQGARTGVYNLLSAGHRVIYVTSCVPGTADAKQAWLVKWGFLTEKNAEKDFLAVADKTLVKADVLFDDSTVNVDTFPAAAFLVEHWHNAETPCSRPRVRGIFEARQVLQARGLSD